MLAAIFAFFGAALNLVIDSIFKIFMTLFGLFLGTIAICCAFALLLVWLLT